MAGLYIHIPFCHSKCSYCDFYSIPGSEGMDEYIEALLKEWSLRAHEIQGAFDTLYIGGGTPSILPPPHLHRLITGLNPGKLREFTVEVNPEDVTPEYVAALNSEGVDRVSIGIQSFIDTELKAINRRHGGKEAINAIRLLKEGGISNISCDLIYGLPGQTPDSWQYSIDVMCSLGPEHISAYSLSYEPGTRLTAMLRAGKIKETGDDTVEEMYRRLISTLKTQGYEHYEISNFSLPGKRALHNSSYWHFIPYLGLGTSAHSFDGKTRRANGIGIKKYISSINAGKAFFQVEDESEADLINDYIITALRTADGLDMDEYAARFGEKEALRLKDACRQFMSSGKISCQRSRIAITEEAFLVSDGILRELII